jgi:hypothetical protein
MSIIENFDSINIVQIGAGGTGSWLTPLVSKFAYNLNRRFFGQNNNKLSYTIIDDDIVEDRNILRQNFTEWDILKPKAQALINRGCIEYEHIRAKNIRLETKLKFTKILNEYHKETIDLEGLSNDLNTGELIESLRSLYIILGCVDNNKSRRMIYSTLKTMTSLNIDIFRSVDQAKWQLKCPISSIYIDSGNNIYNGQIVTTWFNLDQFDLKNKNQKPINFLQMFKLTEEETTQSCAFFGDQSQSINNLAASLIFCNLQNIIVNDTLPPNLIEFSGVGWAKINI